MSIIGYVISGLIVGLVARAVRPVDDRMGILATILLGIVGAIVAGFAGQALGIYRPDEPAGFIAALIGAVAVLAIAGGLFRRPGLRS